MVIYSKVLPTKKSKIFFPIILNMHFLQVFQDHSGNLEVHESVGPERDPWEVSDEVSKALSITPEELWQSGKDHTDWERGSIILSY